MKKDFITGMKRLVTETLEGAELELLDLEEKQKVDKETGEISNFVSIAFMVPRGYDCFSRCQGSAKIPNGRVKVNPDDLDSQELFVTFKNLEISYVDNQGNVYFRASDYEVKKEG